MRFLRQFVSKKKIRYQEDGFDLDLTYITDNIITMGYPAQGKEAVYRNPMTEVKRFLETKHKDKYRVYNLCEPKRHYDHSHFNGRVEEYPFPDHNPPPFPLLNQICTSIDEWLSLDMENIVVIHCKAGKGRTGTSICAYLIHRNLSPFSKCDNKDDDEMFKAITTAELSLQHFDVTRTLNSKGVTIPSQRRYVKYYELMLRLQIETGKRFEELYYERPIRLKCIQMKSIPHFNNDGGCDPFFEIRANHKDDIIFSSRPQGEAVKHYKKSRDAVITFSVNQVLAGDIKIIFYDAESASKFEHMFHFWFNTFFVDKSNRILLTKFDIDAAHKDKKHKDFDDTFQVELFFEEVPEDQRAGRYMFGSAVAGTGSRASNSNNNNNNCATAVGSSCIEINNSDGGNSPGPLNPRSISTGPPLSIKTGPPGAGLVAIATNSGEKSPRAAPLGLKNVRSGSCGSVPNDPQSPSSPRNKIFSPKLKNLFTTTTTTTNK